MIQSAHVMEHQERECWVLSETPAHASWMLIFFVAAQNRCFLLIFAYLNTNLQFIFLIRE